MLTPEYLADLPEAILKLWEEAELTILRDMARRISTYDYWIPAADYQNERLLASGRTQEEILSVLAGVTKKSEAELRKMMIDAGSRCLQDDVAVYTSAGLTPPAIADSKELTAILNEGYKATAQTMKNLTRTTARTATRQFENALDTAWTQVSSGAMDAESAIRQALKGLSEKGIEAIRYPESGRVDSIETAVRRAVLTGVNQTSARLQEELADEIGCDLVEVSAHAGARPEHAEWQGKIYSRSGTSEKYPDFRSSTGYGTGAGLCGWNCRHTFGPYIEGSPRVWTDEKLEELNAPKYEYNGEQLTEYEARQKEKYFDRQIQRWNREAASMKAAGLDDSEAHAKVREWKSRSRDFALNRTELPHQSAELTGRRKQRLSALRANTIANAIAFDDRIAEDQKNIIQKLASEYQTNLKTVTIGAKKAAGDVDITGNRMRLSDKHLDTAVHEFAHTLASSEADKTGLTDNKQFWKEISGVQRAYHRDVDSAQDSSRWISSYEHASRSKDEFMAEAFTQAKMHEMGLNIPDKYGKDYTYSQQVLDIVDRYFRRR